MSSQPVTPNQDDNSQAPSSITLPAQTSSNSDGSQLPKAPQPQSRLGAILGAVAKVASVGLSGIPDKGRPGFVQGLGQGARAEQASEVNQQQIKFQNFRDMVAAAQLHNDDLRLQMQTEEQQAALQKIHDDYNAKLEASGVTPPDQIDNNSAAVINHLQTHTAANPAGATVPPASYVSADGSTIIRPHDDEATTKADLEHYNLLAKNALLSLPQLSPKADHVPAANLQLMKNMLLGGTGPAGEPLNDQNLPGLIANMKTKIGALKDSNADPYVQGQAQNILKYYQATLQNHQDAADTASAHQADLAASAEQKKKQAETAGEIAAKTTPQAIAGQAKLAQAIQDTKPDKPQSTDWRPGVTTMQKNKTDLAENIAENANAISSILLRRPDIVGAIGGRATTTEQMIGNNDPDISALGTRIHNIAMASNGIHGQKGNEATEATAKLLLNNFKNGPGAVAGALNAMTGSVQTFIDESRPDGYKTHSKQGGALRGMMSQTGAK